MNLTYGVVVFCACLSTIVVGQNIISPDEFESMGQQMKKKISSSAITYGGDRYNDRLVKNNNPYANAVEAIYGIGVRLQILLEQSDATHKNFIVSPISVAVAVGQLMLGSTGKTRDYLAEAFIARPDEDTASPASNPYNIPFLKAHRELGDLVKTLSMESTNGVYDLKAASALFLQPNVPLNKPFQETLESVYNATVVPTDFHYHPREAQQLVNSWADRNTGGRIKVILPQPAPRSSVAILANSIYFKADWETPFSREISKVGPFNITPHRQINVTYLRGQQDIRYSKSDSLNCTMIELPYVGNKINMYVILPNEDNGNEYDIAKFSTKLKSRDIIELIDAAKPRSVVVVLPKMSLSSTLSLLDPLKQYKKYKELIVPSISLRLVDASNRNTLDEKIETYKNNTAFTNSRFNVNVTESNESFTLDGASPDRNFNVNDIVQQISLAINEKGTEAAAITADIINYSGNVLKFRAVRPFLFFIRHRETGANLFWGTIVNPTE